VQFYSQSYYPLAKAVVANMKLNSWIEMAEVIT
jgi:hypothetical protein